MFYDLKGLIKEIENGKTTDQIVEERLEYLSSKEYQQDLLRETKHGFFLVQGFATEDTIFKIGDFFEDVSYYMDEKEIFTDIIDNFIRPNIAKIKQIGYKIPLGNIINRVRYYFEIEKPDAKSYKILENMVKKGFDRERKRENFGEEIKAELIKELDEETRIRIEKQINQFENIGGTIPIPISAIKGICIGQCVEMSLLSQNLLAFLGYNIFMTQGVAICAGDKPEAHQFNFIEKDGRYCLFDAAIGLFTVVPDIKVFEDMLTFGEMKIQKGENSFTYVSCKAPRKAQNAMAVMSSLAKRGENYRNEAMSDLKAIAISKELFSEARKAEENVEK